MRIYIMQGFSEYETTTLALMSVIFLWLQVKRQC